MDSERWQKIRELYKSAGAINPGERAEILDKACQDDPSLCEEIEGMLEAGEEMGDFLETAAPHKDPTRVLRTFLWAPVSNSTSSQAGGIGTVYEADQAQPRRKVAVKIMKAGSIKYRLPFTAPTILPFQVQ